jgi:hypothetical protein
MPPDGADGNAHPSADTLQYHNRHRPENIGNPEGNTACKPAARNSRTGPTDHATLYTGTAAKHFARTDTRLSATSVRLATQECRYIQIIHIIC